MRTENSVKNSAISTICFLIQIIISFVAQRLFIRILNSEYLGVNGLFSNILTMLSIAELGIGEAIVFHLYKPIAEDNKEKIKSLVSLYKKVYTIIMIAVLAIGTALIPFLQYFIGETTLDINFNLVYLLFLFQTAISYILTYKRSLFYAYQKNYIVTIVHIICVILLNTAQILVLYLTKNYYIYLIIKIAFVLLENIVINIFVNKNYPFIKEKNVERVEKEVEKDILKRVGAQFFHKIGGIVVCGTDNIIISKFLGLLVAGIYSNYFLVITSVKSLFAQLVSPITASVGDLLVEGDEEKAFSIYKKIRFFNFWISTFACIATLVIMQSFITLWFGQEFLLPQMVLIVLIIDMYQSMMKTVNELFLSAGGICIETKYVPIVESVLNIVFSIVLVKIYGLAGVFMGTIISSLALWCYKFPKFTYKKLLGGNYKNYIKENLAYMFIFAILAIGTYLLSMITTFENLYMQFTFNVVISLILPNLALYFIYRKTDDFKYFLDLLDFILKKKKQS